MDATLQLTHERVDDVPLLLGFMTQLNLPQILDQCLPPHPLHQGLSTGWLITIWIAYILSQADHRKSHVQAWADNLKHTLEALTEQSHRSVEFSDDRLTLALERLAGPPAWHQIESQLWSAHCNVYALPVASIRLDATTSSGYHATTDDGVMQLGHSKDHRPDLAQFKLMAAAAQPSGHLIVCDVHPGNAADDPLYLPLYGRVRALMNQSGLLYAGDCKMAALETRAEIARHKDHYLTPLPMTGQTKDEFPAWVEEALRPDADDRLVSIRDGAELLGKGYEFGRAPTWDQEGTAFTWTERVLVFQSASLADSQANALERRLQRAEGAVRGLTPPPGRGKTQFTAGWELEKAVAAVLAQHEVEGLLEVEWAREGTSRKRYVGRGRGGLNRAQRTEWTVRYQITTVRRNEPVIQERKARLGWRVLVTNAPKTRLPLAKAVLVYRDGVCLERDFHLLKDRPLGISPLYVRRDDQIQGLTHLLTLALRILTLFELVVRRGQSQSGEKLKGLYPGQANRTTDRPTGFRVLAALANLEITLTRMESEGTHHWHLPPLPELLVKVLGYLGLPETVYTRLVDNST